MKGDRTRAAILERAVDIASLEGLEGLTIGRLADDLRMSKSGLFAHFGSKEELQLAALETAKERFIENVVRPAIKAERGYPRLIGFCRGWLDYVTEQVFPGGCFFAAASFEFDGRPGPVRDAVAQAMDDWMATLEKAVQMAQEAGHLDPDIEPAQLAFEMNSIFFGANFACQLRGDRKAVSRAWTALEQRLEGLRTAKPTSSPRSRPARRETPPAPRRARPASGTRRRS
jgi:AcrR family transcriptional regulator